MSLSARQVTSLVDATANTQTAYGYDARGNRTTAATTGTDGTASTSAVFDLANRLTTWAGADGTSTTYTYAATGLRASATTTTGEQTSTEQYVWDTLAGVPLLLSDASFAYVYGLGTAPLEQVQSDDGTVDFLHTDLIGSVRTTTDATGQVTSDADYDAYGRPQPVTDAATATITRFGYAGEYTDPTGLIYLRARYYDPQSAQFLSIDPLVQATADAYGYTAGNPLQFTDPLGLSWYNPTTWTASTWDNISLGLTVAAIAVSATGIGAPVGAILMGASMVANAGAMIRNYNDGNCLAAAAGILGFIPGGGKLAGKAATEAVEVGARELAEASAERVAKSAATTEVPTVVFSRSRAPGIAGTFDDAVAEGAPTQLNRVTGAARDANRRAALRGQSPAPAGQSLDEYPFACSAQGGCGSTVRPVPVGEQNYQGGVLSRFFQDNGIG
ncbi:MAG: hypothetical protein HGA44_13610, partial [Cellulomonadaceae bacterium]|nr:hypothetical protein [Cellulomonadaceae bacterium]